MADPIPTVLRGDGDVASSAEPLFENARVLKGRVVEDLQSIQHEIDELRQQARQLVEQARQEADEIRQQAREQGRKEAMQECNQRLAKARKEYSKLKKRAEHDMVTMAFHIARRIIGRAIELDPKVVTDIVGEVLVSARGREQIVVRVHPDDHEHVEAMRDDYVRSLDGIPVYFEADAELERGGCVIETESGRIDARLDTQLEVLRQAVMDGEIID